MKFTLSWLNDHLATKATLDDILALMLQAGLEVEEVVDPREKLAAFTVCKVKAAEPHSDADKLRVCTVDTVDGVHSGAQLRARQETAQDPRHREPWHDVLHQGD